MSVKTRRSKFQTPVHTDGVEVPLYQHSQTTKIKKRMKVQNLFSVAKVETNDTLKETSRDRGMLYFRLAIVPSGNEETLTDAQKAMLAKLGEKARNITLKGQLTREISNIFPATILSDYVDGLDTLTAEDLTDETQDDVVSQLADILKGNDEKGNRLQFIFTYYTFSVADLLKGTGYEGAEKLYTENGSIVRQRNNLYFGFFDDEEEAFSFMRSRLISAIEEEDLTIEAPENEEAPAAAPAAPAKPKISLKH